MIRRALVLLALTALLPATADAAVTRKKAIWGPVEVESQSQFPTYKDLGAGIYQTKLEWDKVAVLQPLDAKDPLDASYEWPDEIDTAIDEARANGIAVALTVTGLPDWTSRTKAAQDLGDFVTAAARRYPAVHLWTIWEDPAKTFSASRYARVLDPAYAALKARSRRNLVAGAGDAAWAGKLGRARMDLYAVSTTRALTAKHVRDLADAAGERLFINLSLTTGANQAKRLSAALKVARRSADVYSLGYRGLYDEDPTRYGLVDPDGTKRPAYNAFKRG